MARDERLMAEVVPLARRRPSLPPEVEAVLALLRAISDPQLRRYCMEQIGAAETEGEVADALALTRALGAAAAPAAAVAAGGGKVVGLAPAEPAGLGQDPGAAHRAALRAARKRKVRCITTSSSP